MNISNERLDSAARRPLPQALDAHARNFSAAKDSVDRSKDDNVSNKGPTSHAAGQNHVTKPKLESAVDKAKNNLDSMSEMGEMETLRLQMAMDRESKLMSTLSNILKKESDTAEGITANLK